MDQHDFWTAVYCLVEASEIVIDRAKGTRHPRYGYLYEADYGYLEDTSAMDGGGIDLWRGSGQSGGCDAVIVTVDLTKRDAEIKLLLGCTDEEKEKILAFHNGTEWMKALLIRREQAGTAAVLPT